MRLAHDHRASLDKLLRSTHEFTADEVTVALELVEKNLGELDDYRFWVDVEGTSHDVRGFVCFGPTPLTQGTFDLYWIAVDPKLKRHGIGRTLVLAMEDELVKEGARLVRIETEGGKEYTGACRFYESMGYQKIAQIPGFYRPSRDLVIYARDLMRGLHEKTPR